MNVTIVGAGNMGKGIGTRLAAGGHGVRVVDTDPDQARQLAEEIGGGAKSASLEDSLDDEVVVLAVPFGAAEALVKDLAGRLDGKVVVDITNPVDSETFDGLVTPDDSSAAEELSKLAPGARLVKAFNTTFAGTLVEGKVGGQPLDVFIAGDDSEAKEKVSELVGSGGLNAIDAGPLRRARQLEHMGFLHMAIQDSLGTGYMSTLKALS